MVQFPGIDHDEYAVGGLRLRNASETDPARIAGLERFARTILRYTAELFDAHHKNKSEARAFLAKAPEANGVPEGLIRRRTSKTAHPLPPSRDDFTRLAQEKGIDAAAKTFEAKITCVGARIQVELNGKPILKWDQEPHGKIKDFALEGDLGLQNHDSESPVYFRRVHVKEL